MLVLFGMALLELNCGGKSDDDAPGGTGGTAASGGTWFNSSASHSGGAAPTSTDVPPENGGASAGSCVDADRPSCISGCGDSNPQWFEAVCADGEWRCPAGSLSRASCPANACAMDYSQCCNSVTGETTRIPCGLDGAVTGCPSGTRPMQTQCIPDGLNVTDCMDLSDLQCDTLDQECNRGGAVCTCMARSEWDPTDKTFAWVCMVDLI